MVENSRRIECRATGEICRRADCSRSICKQEKAERVALEASRLRDTEKRHQKEVALLEREIKKLAKEWLPRLIVPGQRITPTKKAAALKEIQRHPKIIDMARKRLAEGEPKDTKDR